jgi:hypothetical protein
VDQICINQQNDIEKNHQVQQMMEIYSEAESVIAWLGTTADGSDRLLKHVGRIGQFIWAGEYQRVFAPHQSREAQEAIGLAFRSLCERDYWKRLWIMQEYAVANRLRIACGDVMVWDWQLQAVLVFMNRVSLNSQGILPGDHDHGIEAVSQGMVRAYRNPATSFMEGVVTRRDRYRNQAKGNYDPLFRVLITTLVLENDYSHPLSTDPRDRIFSILQLASDSGEFGCFPNYTLTCEKVFLETALIMLRQGHIDILAYCQFPQDSLDMPTWVPDWRMQIYSPCTGPPWINNFLASADTLSKQVVLCENAHTVVLQGVLVDSVDECGDIWDPNWLAPLNSPAAMAYLEQVRKFCETSPRFMTPGEAQIAAACIAIAFANNAMDEKLLGHPADAFLDVLRRLKKHTSLAQATKADGKAGVSTEQDAFETDLKGETSFPWYTERLRLLHSRLPFISKTGLIGIAPKCARPGDIICIFLGGNVPYVIRPVEYKPETYLLVGEVYIYSIMNGEFMQGVPKIIPIRLK